MLTGTPAYATFNFKTATWDNPLPEDGYFVGYKVYPYYGTINPEDITITSSVGADIASAERLRFVATPSTYTVDIPKADAPKGIIVDGTTFKGLNKNTTYSVAPYSVIGADNASAVEIKGVTSYTLPEGAVGPYGIYVKGDGIDLNNSDAYITYVRGAYTTRQSLHDRNTSGYYKVSKTKAPGSFSYTSGDWSTHSTFTDGISTLGDHISYAQFSNLYTAYTAADATDETKSAAFDTMIKSSAVQGKYLQYNMAYDEIIPISEVFIQGK